MSYRRTHFRLKIASTNITSITFDMTVTKKKKKKKSTMNNLKKARRGIGTEFDQNSKPTGRK